MNFAIEDRKFIRWYDGFFGLLIAKLAFFMQKTKFF